ncbi:MAG TPA: BMP family protein [Fimbriimonas sp.]|nr:BMP family protein [Fimbriimonas sp.]
MKCALLSVAALLLLVGCNSSTDNNAPAPAPSSGTPAANTGKKLKVALLTPGPVSDAGWSAMAYDGLTEIKDKLGAEVSNEEASSEEKIKDSMRSYAQKGYDLIFGHGYEYNAPGVELAADFPNTVFVSSSGDKTAKNAGAFRFELEQGFYLAGIMAAKMDTKNHLAMIGGDDVPSIRSTFDAFKAGAESVKPGIKVDEVFTGSGSDIAKAKAATEQVISSGADFVIHQANAAAQGVFDACKDKGVYAFGANADQNDNASGAVIASAVIVAKPAFLALAKAVQAGTYTGTVQKFGMKDGAIDFVVNPKLKDKVPADAQKLLDDTKDKIKNGAVTVPEAKF